MPLHSARKSTAPVLSLGLASILSASALAQNAPARQACTSSAWTGTASYSRTQYFSHSNTAKRVSGRGEDTKDSEMDYRYKALLAVVESPDRDGSSVATATVEHTRTFRETGISRESNSCDRGKTWQEMTGTFVTEQLTKAEGKDVANITIGVNDNGTYSIGVAAPRIQGMTSGSQKSSYSGQCTAKEGKTFNYPQSETGVDGGSLVSNGKDRVDPANPTRLSGSYSQTHEGITEAISWNLEKCGAPLRVTNLTFEDMRFPNWNMWRDLSDQGGTVDGNFVRMKATVFNDSAERKSGVVYFKETYKGDHWNGAMPDKRLIDQPFPVTLEPGEAKEVEILWDSSGYAWFDDGRARLVQRVKAEIWENNRLADDLTRNLKIAPKPVVLVHGWQGNWKTFESWQNILTTSHSYDWKAFPVGEKSEKGKIDYTPEAFSPDSSPVAQTAAGLKSYIQYAQLDRNAWHVDVVAHSSGGIAARYYVSQMMPPPYPDFRPQVSRLVMLGTPNMGTPCVLRFVATAMATGRDTAFMKQLGEDEMATFNEQHTDRKGVKFSALAGKTMVPVACTSLGANDGIVPVPSAHWTIEDRGVIDLAHEDLTGTEAFSSFVKPHVAIGPTGNPVSAPPAN
jgi:pimeloyl-ACP methyl ester carboxylesterase